MQDALILLKASFSAPKVLHLLRCSPSVSHPSVERFDALLKQAIQRITNSVISDLQWIQASLPVTDGGLGVRRVSSLALPAFLASAASTLSLQDDILTECAHSYSNFPQSRLADWSAEFGDVPHILPTKHAISDRPGVLESRAKVEANFAFTLALDSSTDFWICPAYHRVSFLAASCVCSAHRLMRIEIRRRGSESCSRFEAGSRSLHSTSVPLRFTSRRSWASQFCLQKSTGHDG